MQDSELRTARENKYLTLQELAQELGVTWQYVSYIERGERPMPERLEKKWREILGLEEETK